MSRRLVVIITLIAGAAVAAGASVADLGGFDSAPKTPATGVSQLTQTDQAVQKRAFNLLSNGPLHITCSAAGATFSCSSLDDSDVIARVKAGGTVYQRTVRADIPQQSVIAREPVFAKDELTCKPPVAGEMECEPVSDNPPSLSDTNEVVTYSPTHMTFADDGEPMLHIGEPVIPLAP
jgi:hypothetical protein